MWGSKGFCKLILANSTTLGIDPFPRSSDVLPPKHSVGPDTKTSKERPLQMLARSTDNCASLHYSLLEIRQLQVSHFGREVLRMIYIYLHSTAS